ncbi:hypothetical protein L0152_28390, partial [bacterium]|nr:hypothetical protein [bacterium]
MITKNFSLENTPSTIGLNKDQWRIQGVDPLSEDWSWTTLKNRYCVKLGKMLQNEPQNSNDSLELYLRAANLVWSGVDLTDVKSMWFSTRERKQFRLEPGDLLVSEGGDVGRCSIWKGEIKDCYFQNAINRVRSKGNDRTEFLFYWIYH